ncbi:MAG: hypothetical protein ACK5RK_04150 [Betaproteobacteria bacterium]
MNASALAAIAFVCAFGGALAGMAVRRAMPQHHFDADSRDTIKVGAGLIATMTALVLGLVTASAKSTFDSATANVQQVAVAVLVLDRTLARYGPQTREVRTALRDAISTRVDSIWPRGAARSASVDPSQGIVGANAESVARAIHALQPADDAQRALQARATDQAETLLKSRWLVLSATEASIPLPFIAILLAWLAAIFASFGLFAPRNATVIATLFVCAVSVAGALFLVLEMESPFDGLLHVSDQPLRYALARLGR